MIVHVYSRSIQIFKEGLRSLNHLTQGVQILVAELQHEPTIMAFKVQGSKDLLYSDLHEDTFMLVFRVPKGTLKITWNQSMPTDSS